MASLSNFSGREGQQTYGNNENLTLSECTCPICLYILVEPVTMPCQHELCRRCFQKNVQEASLTCPLCRRRISTWARKAAKEKKLVNQKRWEQIQNAFPVKVANRLEGLEDASDSEDEEDFIYVPNIAAPGEIREEYERELRELEAEREKVRFDEEAASRDLIRQLQEEEEVRRQEQEQLRLEDEQLVRRLMAENETPSPASIRSTPRSTMLDRFVTRGKTPPSHSPPTDGQLSGRPSPSPGTSNLSRLSRNSIRSFLQTPARATSSWSRSSSVIILEGSDLSADLNVSRGPSTSPTTSHRPWGSTTPKDSPRPAEATAVKGQTDSVKPAAEQRPDSADSLSQELCHFKPIHCSPRTPPRRVAGGACADPPIIRSTPRNLSQPTTDSEGEGGGIPDGSPVMKRRLSQLDQERKEKVAAMSKSTGPDLPLLPVLKVTSPDQTRSDRSPPPQTEPSDRQQGAVRTLSFDAEPTRSCVRGDPKPQKPMILPLEPNLDSDSETEGTLSPLNFSGDRNNKLSTSKRISEENTPSGLDTWLRLSHQRQKERDKRAREDKAAGRERSPCMNPEVTTTLLTPNTLLERQQKVRLGNYVDDTPETICEKNDQRMHSAGQTEGRLGGERSPAHGVTKEARERLPTYPSLSVRPTSRGDSATAGCSTDTHTKNSLLEDNCTERITSSEETYPNKKVARIKPRLQGAECSEETEGTERSKPGGDKMRCKQTTKKNKSPVKCNQKTKPAAKPSPVKGTPPRGSVAKASPEKDSPSKRKQSQLSPAKKSSPQKEPTTPTRRSERRQAVVRLDRKGVENEGLEACVEGEKSRRRLSSEQSEASSREGDTAVEGHKPGLKRVRSTEDKENEDTLKDQVETPVKRQRTTSHDPEDYSSDEVFNSPKNATHEHHFPIEYSPEANGKKLKKFAKPPASKSRLSTKGKQSKLCFVRASAAGSSSGTQSKLVFTAPTTVKGPPSGAGESGPGRRRRRQRSSDEEQASEEDSEGEVAVKEEEVVEPRVLDRSHFTSDAEYKAHLEEQDRLLALQLQADFDLERRLRLTAIRRKGSDGQYELRKKTSSTKSGTAKGRGRAKRSK